MKTNAFLVYLILLVSSVSQAEPIFYCESEKLLTCLNLTKLECTQATDKSIELCSDKHELDGKTYEEAETLMDKVSNCANKQFLLIASITTNELKECGPQFTEALSLELSRIRNIIKHKKEPNNTL